MIENRILRHCELIWFKINRTAPEILFAETNSGSDSEEEEEKNTNLKYQYSKQSDVYSVGIIIYEMLNRSFPFEGHHNSLLKSFFLCN